MPRIRRILVAVKNPSAKNSPAVIKGAQLARALNAELILFHAISVPLYVDGDLTLLGGGLADVESTTRNTCLGTTRSDRAKTPGWNSKGYGIRPMGLSDI